MVARMKRKSAGFGFDFESSLLSLEHAEVENARKASKAR